MFACNLKQLRGRRTQADIAEAANIPLRSYQHAESGIIPQQPNREAIAKAFGVPTNALFIDSKLSTGPVVREVSAAEALEVLRRFVEGRQGIPPEAAQIIKEGLTLGVNSRRDPAKPVTQLVKKKSK